jgi:hypothetical protein
MIFQATRILGIAAILLAVAGPQLAPAQDSPRVQTQGGVTYTTGGVGTDERAAIEAISGQFNLKISLATKTGHFEGDAGVRIVDTEGHTVLDAKTDGPLFYAHLTPGTYKVIVNRKGTDIQETAHVTDNGQARLQFTWSDD